MLGEAAIGHDFNALGDVAHRLDQTLREVPVLEQRAAEFGVGEPEHFALGRFERALLG